MKSLYSSTKSNINLLYYKFSGRKPWSRGYSVFKNNYITNILMNDTLLNIFLEGNQLPNGYGIKLDERVIEYPWIISRMNNDDKILLDAGSGLNYKNIITHKSLKKKKLTILTLAPENNCFYKNGISYLYDDLRNLPLRDETFDMITCVSTLEHIGMDNTKLYTDSSHYLENNKNDFKLAVKELYRVLKPGGKALFTVPFGKYQSYNWFQVFDNKLVDEVIKSFNAKETKIFYYLYKDNGWVLSNSEDCSTAEYNDFHNGFTSNNKSAAAGAVCCLELIK